MFGSEFVRIEKIENLAIEGVATKAAAYSSALNELEKRFPSFLKNLKRAGGDSSGAITSMLICLGYTGQQIEEIVQSEDYQKLLASNGILGDSKRLLENYGIYDNSDLFLQLQQFIKQSTGNADLTFGELHTLAERDARFKDLYVISTQVTLINNKPKFIPKIFCYENAKDTRIVDAVLASSAICFVYPAVRLKRVGPGHYVRHPDGHAYVDGGVTAQVVPVTLFDAASKSLRKSDDVLGEPIPCCEPARFATYLLEAIRSQDLTEMKTIPGFNTSTLSLHVATPTEIKQLTDTKFKEKVCLISHPIQALEDKITQDANRFIFGPRDRMIQQSNHGRIIFIPTPSNISVLTFALSKEQIAALLVAGRTTIQRYFPSEAEAFALTRVPVGRTFTEAAVAAKEFEKEKTASRCEIISCVIL